MIDANPESGPLILSALIPQKRGSRFSRRHILPGKYDPPLREQTVTSERTSLRIFLSPARFLPSETALILSANVRYCFR